MTPIHVNALSICTMLTLLAYKIISIIDDHIGNGNGNGGDTGDASTQILLMLCGLATLAIGAIGYAAKRFTVSKKKGRMLDEEDEEDKED